MLKNQKSSIYIDSSIIKINNLNKKNDSQNSLIKLNEELSDKNLNYKNDNDIDKIEERLFQIKKQDLFIRENQISRPVDEIIVIPKKKIKDEVKILSEYKKERIKINEIRKIEKEKDNINRKLEMEKNFENFKRYNDKKNSLYKIYKKKVRKENIKFFVKYVMLILVLAGLLIMLIIFLDKYT